ncbi:hypothetical protein POTOM_052534 [Populus tomentosa]|uniref:Uncharacterized protein n=1 Tax=Populus tomentosa TaxID=118781 RepID=A0A8X7Y3R1_POPTO|nr:hypothetical protein POTOM_052534 [Populus tomentosa]
MAQFGGSFTHVVMAMVVVALLRVCGVMAQDIAPPPAMDTGAGLELPLSMAVISSSMIFSLLALMYVLIAEFHGVWYRTLHIGEALFSIPKALVLMLVIATFAAAVSGQDSETAPAPAPGMDAGAGFSLPVSGAIVGFSLVVSLLGFLKH